MLVLALALPGAQAFGQAVSCEGEIAAIERLRQSGKITPEMDETAAAKLHRQPTAQSLAQADKEASNELDNRLAQARTLAQKRDTEGCLAVIAEIKKALAPTN